MYQRIGQMRPWAGYCWKAFYPLAEDEVGSGTVLGDLIDNFADIRRDLEDVLLALGAGVVLGDVEAQWRRDYWSHWGFHALSAMRMLTLRLTERG